MTLTSKAAVSFFCLILASVGAIKGQPGPKVIWEKEKAAAVFVPETGTTGRWQVFKKGSQNPVFGRLTANNIFRPVVAFQPGHTYVIKQNDSTLYHFTIEPHAVSAPEVLVVYPAANTLPANLLKFYIRFSEPMSEGNPYPGIHLLTAAGDTLEGIFLHQLPALWNAERTVLTLWLDPGRIKRDLLLNRRYGNPLEAGEKYELIISPALKSRKGAQLAANYRKQFLTDKADRKKPDIKNWQVTVPKESTYDSLRIYFQEPMDYFSTIDNIEVLCSGERVAGRSALTDDEEYWTFLPDQPWKKGRYTVQFDAVMEDLAGNNLNRLFDRNIKKDQAGRRKFYSLAFEVDNR